VRGNNELPETISGLKGNQEIGGRNGDEDWKEAIPLLVVLHSAVE